MPIVLVIVAALLIVSALRNTQADMAGALATDVPPFLRWAAAIGAVGAIGYIPKAQAISRPLIGLILLVLVIRNYRNIFTNLQQLAGTVGAAPAQAAKASPPVSFASGQGVTLANVTGSTGAAAGTTTPAVAPFGVFDPTGFLTAFEDVHSPGVA
jgi:predicted membrane protein